MAARLVGSRILIVEEHTGYRQEWALLLAAEGYHVECAADGLEAVQHLRDAPPPDLILLDLMMPRMTGWEFRSEQRQEPALAAIPVVVISAIGDLESQAPALGAAAYLPKPVKQEDLLSTVACYCRPLTPEPARRDEPISHSEYTHAALDLCYAIREAEPFGLRLPPELSNFAVLAMLCDLTRSPHPANSDQVVRLAGYYCVNVRRVIAQGAECCQDLRDLSDLELLRELARRLRDGSNSAPVS